MIATFEAPDEETLAAALLTLAAQGNLRTTTLRAFTADEMKGGAIGEGEVDAGQPQKPRYPPPNR